LKTRSRLVSGFAALAALLLASLAEASLSRASAPATEAPALTRTLALGEFSAHDPDPALFAAGELAPVLARSLQEEAGEGRLSLFVGDELAAALEAPNASSEAGRFHPLAAVSLLSKDEAEPPLVSAEEPRYQKTRYRVFDFLGAPLIGVFRGVTLNLRWGCGDFSCRISEDIFQGLWTDPVTGISYARARWYDARNAVFLSEDSQGDRDSPNLYAFVGLRPHEFRDPLGLEASLSQSGWIVIANVHTGRIRRISPAEIASNGDEVRAALGLEAGLDPREADAMMKRAGGGAWTNNAKVTALSKGVSEEVDRQARFAAKTWLIMAGGAATGGLASAAGAGAVVAGAAGGVGAQGTSDVIEGKVSSAWDYTKSAVGGAILGKIFSTVSIGEGPSTLGLEQPSLPAPRIIGGENRYTRAGRLAHNEEPLPPGFKRKVRLPSGREMDAYNEAERRVIEIKPNNPRAIRRGEGQVGGYCQECDEIFGPGHAGSVQPYDPEPYLRRVDKE
jgi:RHS repeat-associated protein